jgi:lactate permease
MPWSQNYDPLGAWPLSTALAALPVVTLFFVLVALRARVWIAAFSGMVVALAIALTVFGMPARLAGGAVIAGIVFGFLRIAWIIVASIFLYHVAVETGQFAVMKRSIARLSSDRRIQAVLIAFCFGAFLEGTGGGGAPVAIAGAFLIGLGFKPFEAAVLCLVANTAPVAWGGVGNPIRVLHGVTGLPEMELSAMAGRILPPFSLILPIWLVRMMTGWKGTFEVLPALLVAGGSFAAMQYYWSNHVEIGLVDVTAALLSLVATVLFLKVWRPSRIELVAAPAAGSAAAAEAADLLSGPRLTAAQIAKGWSPFIVASVFIFVTGVPALNAWLKSPALNVPLPMLHNQVLKVAPVAPRPTPESAVMDLNGFALPGTAVVVATFLVAPFLGMPFARTASLFGRTVRQLVPSLAAISCMVALAYVTKYAGMDAVLGLSLTHTGWVYPFFGTLLGWLGVALTGTDAGSNALFGNLQKVTAEQLGLSPVLMASANTTGGVMGKMIDAQSIVVASISTHQEGNEAAIFKAVFWHSLSLAALVGVVVMLYAYVWPWAVPGAAPHP